MQPVPRTSSTIRRGSYPTIPGRPTRRSSTTSQPGIAAIAARVRAHASIVRSISASPCTNSWRRAASRDACSSAFGLVDRTSRTTRARSSGSTRPLSETSSIAVCVRLPTILCVEASIASAPSTIGFSGSLAWNPKCAPQEQSTTSGTPAAWATSAQAADIGGHPVVRRRDDERRPGVGAAGERGRERLGRDAVSHPELSVVLGRDEARETAAEDQTVEHARMRIALHDDPRPGRREREAERVVALGRAVGQEPRAPGAVRLRGERLGAREGRRRRTGIDPDGVERDVEQQRVLPERTDAARDRRRLRPCGPGV